MPKNKLTEEQKNNIIADKENGMTNPQIMKKHNVSKMTIYNIMGKGKEKEKEEEDNNVEETEKDIDDIEIDDDYLQHLTDEPKEKKKKTKEEPINKVEKYDKDLVNNLLHKIRDGNEEEEKKETKKEKKETKEEIEEKKERKEEIEGDKRIQIINKIKNYCNTFEKKINEIRPISDSDKKQRYLFNLSKMSTSKLNEELEIIRLHIGGFSSYDAMKIGYITVVDIVEKGGTKIGFDIEGFKKDVEDNAKIDAAIKELSCEYSIDRYLDPKLKLAGLTALQLISTNRKNNIIKNQQEIISKLATKKEENVSETLINKYQNI